MLRRADYALIEAWRRNVGIADPFGDFELLFFASTLGLGIIDVPIRYKARSYGATNIRRFTDGFMLLRYCARAFGRFKLGRNLVGVPRNGYSKQNPRPNR